MSSPDRPSLVRQDTEQFLSYYQSADAGLTYAAPKSPEREPFQAKLFNRQLSLDSTSSSDYSSDSPGVGRANPYAEPKEDSSPVRRRSSIPSQGGGDRRRLAIVEVDSSGERALRAKSASDRGHESDITHSHNIRSRRGLEGRLGGLALVAPPDASPKTYTSLTPPSTAPIISDRESRAIHVNGFNSLPSKHGRSASEAVDSIKRTGLHHKSSRDVGIVGTDRTSIATERPERRQQPQPYINHQALRPPIFQMPHSRSPSPGYSSDASNASTRHGGSTENDLTPMKTRSAKPLVVTPEIGQEKQIDIPVASPVVVNLGSDSLKQAPTNSAKQNLDGIVPQIIVRPSPVPEVPFTPSVPSSYLHYQRSCQFFLVIYISSNYTPYSAGVHAIAGPLPPPPRVFNIDTNSPPPPRPPRLHSPPPRSRGDLDAVKQALQLSPSISAVLVSKSPTTSLKALSSNSSNADVSSQSNNDDPPIESLEYVSYISFLVHHL